MALTSGFLRTLSISVPISRPQKQSTVALKFLNEKSPCDAASRQNSVTACYYYYSAYCHRRAIICFYLLVLSLSFFIDLPSIAIYTIERHFFRTMKNRCSTVSGDPLLAVCDCGRVFGWTGTSRCFTMMIFIYDATEKSEALLERRHPKTILT